MIFSPRLAIDGAWYRHISIGACIVVTCVIGTSCDEFAGGGPRGRSLPADAEVIALDPGMGDPIRSTVDVVWHDDRLGFAGDMVLVNERIFVADRERIHLLASDGTYIRSVGQAGGGPSDFRRIAAVTAADDRVAVLDVGNSRHSVIDTAGNLVSTHRIVHVDSYTNIRVDSPPYAYWDGGLGWVAGEAMRLDAPTRVALIWQSVETDSALAMGVWNDTQWTDYGGILGAASAYGPRAYVAINGDGTVASGDGQEYFFAISSRRGVRRYRVAYERYEVDLRADDYGMGELPVTHERAAGMRLIITSQPVERWVPVFDRLEFGEDGRLWIRIRPASDGLIHPLLARFRDYRGDWVRWDGIDIDRGVVQSVMLPAAFTPKVFKDTIAFGFYALDSGESAVARARW